MIKLLLLWTLPAAALTAQAEVVDITWPAQGAYTRQAQLAPGKFFELCGKLPAGVQVRWSFEAGTAMDFNVHYHVGKDVVYPSKLQAVAKAADVLRTQVEQDYCWMWTNKSKQPVTLSVTLSRG